MKNLTGKVSNTSSQSGVGKKGPWTLYKVEINDQNFSTFDKKIGDSIKVGQTININYIEREYVGSNGITYTSFDIKGLNLDEAIKTIQVEDNIPQQPTKETVVPDSTPSFPANSANKEIQLLTEILEALKRIEVNTISTQEPSEIPL